MIKKRFLNQMLKKSVISLENHPEYSAFPHWTYIIYKNEIVSIGLNRKYEPPITYGYHRSDDPTFIPKWHSELDAIKKWNIRNSGFDIVNIRLNESGDIRLSKPCKTCAKMLYFLNCRNAYFTTNNNEFDCIKINLQSKNNILI